MRRKGRYTKIFQPNDIVLFTLSFITFAELEKNKMDEEREQLCRAKSELVYLQLMDLLSKYVNRRAV